MAVNYTISPEAYAEDGERCGTLHQCPLCGVAYDMAELAGWGPSGVRCEGCGASLESRWGHRVTDNCDCHSTR